MLRSPDRRTEFPDTKRNHWHGWCIATAATVIDFDCHVSSWTWTIGCETHPGRDNAALWCIPDGWLAE
jgi:hypothetical protein